jgi:tetratricopeptide (TPR) repeat protein
MKSRGIIFLIFLSAIAAVPRLPAPIVEEQQSMSVPEQNPKPKLKRAIESSPETDVSAEKKAAEIAREGAQAAKDQNWNKAIGDLRKAAEMDRKYTQTLASAYQNRAYSYVKDQRFQDALNDLNQSILLNRRDALGYDQRATIEMRINDYDKALADYGKAMKYNPGEIRYHLYRGYIYETRGDVQNSMAETDAALKINPKNKEAMERKQRLQKNR